VLVPMAKVQVLGSAPRLEQTLQVLHRLQVIEIFRLPEDPGLPVTAVPEDEHEATKVERLLRLRARMEELLSLATIPPTAAEPPPLTTEPLTAFEAELGDVEPRVAAIRACLDALQEEAEALPRRLESLRRLLPLLPEFIELSTYETIVLMLDRRHAGLLDLLRQELKRAVGPDHAVITADVDDDTVGVALLMPRRAASGVDAWLGRERLAQLRMPADVVGVPIREAIARTEARREQIHTEIAAAEAELQATLEPHLARLEGVRRFLDGLLDRIDARRLAGAMGHVFVVVGWVPEPRLNELRAAVADEVGPDVVVAQLPLADEDRDGAPLLLRNPGPARSFESLVRLLGLPRYGTADPTVLTALGLPFFFGVMLGDVAYGLALLGVTAVAHRRLRGRPGLAQDLTHVLRIGALWAVAWGAVFGELLGDLGRDWGLQPLWVNREEAIGPLLVGAVGVGLLHITLGLTLGVLVGWRTRRRRDVVRRLSLLGCLVGLVVATGGATGLLPAGLLPAAVAAVLAGVAGLVAAEGALGLLTGPLEVVGTVTNVLSYLRLGALGVASAYLARTANELGALPDSIVLGILLASLFHILNLALGTFSPAIQALRLHYVEFFGTFFEPGGRAFVPFGSTVRPHPLSARLEGR